MNSDIVDRWKSFLENLNRDWASVMLFLASDNH